MTAGSLNTSTINQTNVLGTTPTNTQDKYEQLFKLYDDFQKDQNKKQSQKWGNNFWTYINKESSWFSYDGIVNTYNKLADKNNLEDVKNILKIEQDKANQKKAEQIKVDTEKEKKIAGEKGDRLKWLLELRSAITEFNQDPRYAANNSQFAFLGYLKEKKAKANDTSLTYYGFDANEIELKNGKIEKPTIESIRNEEKIEETQVPEENITTPEETIQEKPEETTLTMTRKRLGESIGRYIDKVKALKNDKEWERKTLEDEIKQLKEEVKREKDTYEKVKKDFFATNTNKFENFSEKDLENVPTGLIRYEQRQGKLFNSPKRNKMDTIRRNRTIHTLIKKFNKMGDGTKNWGKEWVRFIMGFEKARFLRYTGIKVNSAIDKAWSAMGMQMNPQEFHTMFNAGRNNMFAILDIKTSNENNPQEIAAIQAIKNRINYYGALYARERANAWVAPFIDTEKNATKKSRIIQMTPPSNVANAA